MRWAAFGLIAFGLPVAAHDGADHATPSQAEAHLKAQAPPLAVTPLPFDVGGPFELTASTGGARTQADPAGRLQLLFFGYANCEQVCSAALPLMGAIVDLVGEGGIDVAPVMITIDPLRDTPDLMAAKLPAMHPALVGLTGTDTELQVAYDAFSVEREILFTDPDGQPVFAHGSFIYLLDGDGTVLTLIPPVLAPDQAARIVSSYATAS